MHKKIIDVVTYNGERELFEIRYNILKDYVDEFIVVEFDKTFSGKPKEWKFSKDFTEEQLPKVWYREITEDEYEIYMDLAHNSPNTQGADHWKREFCQKESIKDCLRHLQDDDIVFIGDCDEIWHKNILKPKLETLKLKLEVYTYYLNNRSSEEFWGTLVSEYRNIKDVCLNHLRTNAPRSIYIAGWHFTSMHHQLRQKLEDSYTEESYNSAQVRSSLDENIKQNKDFLGREFTYRVDESDWPEYLKVNREKYKHLLK
jgi:hypothetical protein